ncbi:DUF3307 domain-containing protein [Aquicoccus sp. SCR17]|nr:DUF3307 domain-containing protein [Carideicomes alvinocaridis]
MTQTFAALLLAHVLADFVLQTAAMAEGKARRAALPLLLHVAVVAATATLAIGPLTPAALWPLLALAGAHLLIDLAKTLAPADRLGPFLWDQAAHLGTLAALAWLYPALFSDGAWGNMGDMGAMSARLPALMALLAGLIAATRAGGFAVGLLMTPWRDTDLPAGLTNGGMLIGVLERGLIFLFILTGQPAAIGFLIAAKSVLRFDAAKTQQAAGEYVIIGTLASFGWALLASYATLWLLSALPPLGIPDLSP